MQAIKLQLYPSGGFILQNALKTPAYYATDYIYESILIKKLNQRRLIFFPMAQQPLFGCLGLLISRFHGHTHLRHTTLGRTPLDEGPARRRDLYLTTHNTHKKQTSMPPVGFEPTILVTSIIHLKLKPDVSGC
jgi:hypothetical protein